MTSQFFLPRILGLLAVLLLCCGTVRAEPLFKVGKVYSIQNQKGNYDSLPGIGANWIKVIRYGTDQWYWVEYVSIKFPVDKKKPVTVYVNRAWLNFAQLSSVTPAFDKDWSTAFPQGVMLCPFQDAMDEK